MALDSPPDEWMRRWPEAAALAAGLTGAMIRATTAEGPRPFRAVLADACGTVALAWLVYRGALGAGLGTDLAFGSAGFMGAAGWEVARRFFIRTLNRGSRR